MTMSASLRTAAHGCRPATLGRAALAATWLALSVMHALSSAQDALDGPATEGVGLLRHEPQAFTGYTLVSPLLSKTSFLVDMEGRVVRSWDTQFTPASLAYFLENGNLMRAGELPDPPWGGGPASGGRIQEFNWDGELVWDFTYLSETEMPHHDFARLPNGNVILVVKEKKTAEEAIAAGREPVSVERRELQVDTLVEIRPTGKTTGDIVWRWHLWDHLIQDRDPEKENYGDVAAHPELVDLNYDSAILALASNPNRRRFSADWTHVNAVAYNEEFDQLVMSVPRFSEIWIIDHSTTTAQAAGHSGGRSGKGGDLLYRYGNPRAYRAGTDEDRRLFSQHDVHWIARGNPGAGHLLVFNNGNRRPDGNYSSIDEIVTPVDSQGRYRIETSGKFGPDQPVWSYVAPNHRDFYSNFISGAQRLPNGNTLICSGANGIMFEVTPEKQVVWQYMSPTRNDPRRRGGGQNSRSLFRAYRYGPDYPGLTGKQLVPGKSLEELANETEAL